MTLFPDMVRTVLSESIIGRAQDKGLVEVKATNIRDYALDKHHKADDAPYGGGRGQVMLAEPLYLCHEALSGGEHVHTVFLSAQGQPFDQEKARELLAKEQPDYNKNRKTIHESIRQTAQALLAQVGLQEKMGLYPHQLSGGQQQRVAIARALALKPDVLCFDEPTSALDPELTGEVLKVIRGLADRKMTMIIVTHEMAFARDVADRVIFMDGGVIVEQGPAKQLIEHPQEERTRQFLSRYAQGNAE